MEAALYKALHLATQEEIIILHPRWRGRIDHLRSFDQANALVCPGCEQPVRVKAGSWKRPHFAHKHLQACSLGQESPRLLAARAVLYEWLLAQFGPEATLEHALAGTSLPRPVDCWVERPGGAFAYWIVEAGIKLEPRDAVRAGLAPLGGRAHVVFLHSMLREEKKEFHSLLLSPTERALMATTPLDAAYTGAGISVENRAGSLHYLDAEAERLTTYRGLTLFHRPNWYRGVKKTAPLAELRASTADGAPLYPGESARLREFLHQQDLAARRRANVQEQVDSGIGMSPSAPARARWDPANLAARAGQPEPLPCAICGQVTDDYWSTFYDAQGQKRCRCRSCLEG
jgi:hypothetical protein